MDSLHDQERKAHQAIEEWSTSLMVQIRDYTSQQRRLLQHAYESHRKYLEDMRGQFVETSSIYEQNKDTEEINRLIERCKTLEVELVKLNYPSKDTPFIEVIPVEPPEQMDHKKSNQGKTGNESIEKSLIEKSETESLPDGGDSDINSYSKSTYATFNRTKQTLTNASELSTSDNDYNRPETSGIGDDSSNNKCPVCYMIFPSNMSTTLRSIHVGKHYEDN
ncbi:unnamed protein product [Rotaria sp. Silwood2]|nr:unnamed protein product [Rotaria sp. Silwood2]CAF2559402.1 unnamed protein product [Rotaria sp. Silwood2]CAF2829312.1 unnamed protein product [Rotaria sp. Silwood2]CAF4288704.1 unnamed protein product [Rotaria sp. Silwood2]CAF4363712.1 unnamed protein product [Rotaria sp. Silwood2]